MLKMIVAVDRGNAIGWKDGRLPWKIPGDMARFKELTTGGTVVMGWNTFESLGRPNGLPNRRNIVMTRKPYGEIRGKSGDKIDIISSFDWVQASQACLGRTAPDVWLIGGANVYAQALELKMVDEIYLTLVDENSGGDVILPFDLSAWKLFVLQQAKIGVKWYLTEMSDRQQTDDGIHFTFITLKRAR
jgi:dihydrofolate reductase